MLQTRFKWLDRYLTWNQVMFWLLAGGTLFLANLHSFLLFHGLAEAFSMIVAGAVFLLAWNTRRFLHNSYLLFLGVAFAFVAGLDFLHILAYKGMGVFPDHGANLPTQIWIISRYLLALSFLLAPSFLARKLSVRRVFLACALVEALAIWSVFGGWFPECYREGKGLTDFKLGSEFMIMVLFGAASLRLRRHRAAFSPLVLGYLTASLVLNILSDLTFSLYVEVYGANNLVGHLLKVMAYFCVYKALVETGLRQPFELMFRELKQSERTWRALLNAPHESAILLDDKLYIRAINRVAAQRLGGEVTELTGRNFLDLLSGAVRESRHQRLRQVLETGEPQHFQDRREGRDFDLSFYPLLDPQGQAVGVAIFGQDITERLAVEREREALVVSLTQALAEVKTLSGLLPICSNCKRVRDDQGYWNQIEYYVSQHSQAQFSHGICPECARKLYPDLMDQQS